MRLLLMRHADAVNDAPSDRARILSDLGRRQAALMGGWLHRMGVVPDTALSSPYPRASETAGIVVSLLGGATVREETRLASGMQIDTGSALVHEFGDAGGVLLLVGHAPDLGCLAAHLMGADEDAVKMRKGAVACLDVRRAGRGGATLEWLIHPALAVEKQ